MSPAEVLEASRAERRLYEALLATYRELGSVLEGASAEDLQHLGARAAKTTEKLRTLAARLAPVRLRGGDVPPGVAELWGASARIAAELAAVNATLRGQVATRARWVGCRLAVVARGRRAVSAYRPAVPPRARFVHGQA